MAAKARYACLALLFLLGIQLATCGESFQTSYAGLGGNGAAGSYASSSAGSSAGTSGGALNQAEVQSIFKQYFAALQQQQNLFEQQLQAQIDAQRQAGNGAFVSSGALITNDQGQIDPKARTYVSTRTSPEHVSVSVSSRSGPGDSSDSVSFSSDKTPNNRIFEQSNRVDYGSYGVPHSYGGQASYAPYGGDKSYGPFLGQGYPIYGGFSSYPGFGGNGAFASANYGPNGGFETAYLSKEPQGVFSRFAEDLPPPSGKQIGVFSSSSSSSQIGPDGKQITQKSATVGINDNGKIKIKTIHDP